MKVQRVSVGINQFIWLVLNDDYLPIQPIDVFIRYLQHTEKSPDTIRTYATHLKLFWDYLQTNQKNWQHTSISDFAEFVHWLRNPSNNDICLNNGSNLRRTERTVNAILSAVASFYRYHNQLGNTDIKLTELYHVFKNKPVWKRIVGLKVPKTLPKTLTKEQIKNLIDCCANSRDIFLISLLHNRIYRNDCS